MRGPHYKHPRIPRMRAMFASRACRSAVMIGSTLSHSKMTAVVRNLTDLEQPWNCPHGRPTMRHLVDLRELIGHRDGEEVQIASYWGGLAH
jgi:DNA mismatch repair protein PMS2